MYSSSSSNTHASVTCPICGVDLQQNDEITRERHVNACIDEELSNGFIAGENRRLDQDASSLSIMENIESKQDADADADDFMGCENRILMQEPVSEEMGMNDTIVAETPEIKVSAERSDRKCPFYKKLPNTSFVVDAFAYGNIANVTGYFLSHFHADHYGGLTSSFKYGPIYCSKITGNLVAKQLGVAEQYIHRLDNNIPVDIQGVSVTLIDANHCPGSSMFLFTVALVKQPGVTKRYLHTGDFRAHPTHLLHPAIAQSAQPLLDILFLDTTYLSPEWIFPFQDTVIEVAVELVRRAINGNPNNIAPPRHTLEKWLSTASGFNRKSSELAKSRKSNRILILIGQVHTCQRFITVYRMTNRKK